MDLSPITDFFTNIKEKITNPFFGTLILVSLARNWDLFYSLFNFSNNSSRLYKIQYIRNYIVDKNIFLEALINILWASIIVIVGYFFVIVFRTFSIWIEFKAMPYLTGKVVSTEIVRKEEYMLIKEERDKYAERYEEQHKNVREYSKENDELRDKDYEKSRKIETLEAEINKIKTDFQTERGELLEIQQQNVGFARAQERRRIIEEFNNTGTINLNPLD